MIKKIDYANKQAFQNDEDIPDNQKVTDLNMNNIKDVVNSNAEELERTNKKVELGFKSAFSYKGYVNTYDELSIIENLNNGDIYTVVDEEKNYVWNGQEWIEYNVNFDVSKLENQTEELRQRVTNLENITSQVISVVTKAEILQNTNYEVPTYEVGTNSLSVFFEGCKLIKDINYIEVDSTHIQFKDWDVPVGSNLEIIIRKEDKNETEGIRIRR